MGTSVTKHATCMLCEAMCGLAVTVEDGRATRVEGDRDDPLSRGHVCPKALALEDIRLDPDRVREPAVRETREPRPAGDAGHAGETRDGSGWRAVSWDRAIGEAADRLAGVVKAHGRDAVAVYLGNPMAHNGHALVGAGMLLGVLRTKSRFSATSADQLPHMLASLEMFGHQALLPVPDVDRARFFLCIGANPVVSNGSLMTAPGIERRLKDLRARGGRLVVVDPRRTETARIADEHHFVRPGTDALLLMGMVRTLFEEGLVRPGRLAPLLGGREALARASEGFTPERVAPHTGVAAEVTRRLARELAATEGVVYGRIGVCQQEFGAVCAWLVVALNALTGNLDRPGGAMFTTPAIDLVRLGTLLGQRGSFDTYRSKVRGLPEFGGELPVACLAEEIEAGNIRGLVTLAGNPVASTPNGARLARALGSLDAMVSLDIYRNETTRHAHVLLPTTFGLEREHFDLLLQAVAVRNVTRWCAPVFEPPPGVRDDWAISADLASAVATRLSDRVASAAVRAARALGPRRIFDLGMRASKRHLSVAAVAKHPHGLDLGPLEPRLPAALHTPDGNVNLAPARFVADVARLRRLLDVTRVEGELLLVGRRHLRSNNSWMHNSRRLVKGREACTLLMHPQDAEARGLTGGARVRLRSRVGEVVVPLEVSDEIAPGVVSLPHGWGHGLDGVELRVARERAGASINDVTDDARVDALSGNAAFSGTPVWVERDRDAAE
ncbi:MAG TPA: molybdopterin-dependent oxidoreductase [Polyangiaceae bacterium]|jgi:anaerobic selenocysteine-containing dehydrogenase